MRALLLLLTLLVAVPMAFPQTVVVHPNQYLTTEGVTNNVFPFGFTTGAGHYQQSYDATQFTGPITITEMSFRYKGDTAKTGGTVNLKVTLCYSTVAWNALSGTFASNLGTGQTVVFNGNWVIAPFPGDPAVPNPFTARLTLSTPFSYDPAQGDLLMDCEIYQAANTSVGGFARCSNSTGIWRVYANTGNPTDPVGTVGDVGLITEFTGSSQIIPYGTGCAGAGGFVPALNMSGTPSVGNQIALTLDQGLGGVMSALLITAAKGSTPIGASTCTLLVAGPPITLFIPLGGSGAGNGSYQLPAVIPVVTPVTIYMQAFVNDPAGPIGLSVSNGLQVDIK